jgi:catechol 2,3-dioxygenase-like lactoylglutathione lyase family enzyme
VNGGCPVAIWYLPMTLPVGDDVPVSYYQSRERRRLTEDAHDLTRGSLQGLGGERRHRTRRRAACPPDTQEPTEQPYGVRACAFRDPAGNLIRIQELR